MTRRNIEEWGVTRRGLWLAGLLSLARVAARPGPPPPPLPPCRRGGASHLSGVASHLEVADPLLTVLV